MAILNDMCRALSQPHSLKYNYVFYLYFKDLTNRNLDNMPDILYTTFSNEFLECVK